MMKRNREEAIRRREKKMLQSSKALQKKIEDKVGLPNEDSQETLTGGKKRKTVVPSAAGGHAEKCMHRGCQNEIHTFCNNCQESLCVEHSGLFAMPSFCCQHGQQEICPCIGCQTEGIEIWSQPSQEAQAREKIGKKAENSQQTSSKQKNEETEEDKNRKNLNINKLT